MIRFIKDRAVWTLALLATGGAVLPGCDGTVDNNPPIGSISAPRETKKAGGEGTEEDAAKKTTGKGGVDVKRAK